MVSVCPFVGILSSLFASLAEGICFNICGTEMCNQRALFEEVPAPVVGCKVNCKALKCC
jgi:hypothetical protein